MAERRAGTARRLTRVHRQVLLPLAAVAAWVLSGAAWGTELLGGQISSTPDFTRIVLEATSPAPYKVFTLPDPPRLVVDIEETRSAAPLASLASQISPLDKRVRGVRVGRFKPDVVRVVFELEGEVQPQPQPWKASGSQTYRLVLDVRLTAPDPVMALLSNRDSAALPPAGRLSTELAPPVPPAPAAEAAKPGPEPGPALRRPPLASAEQPDKPAAVPVRLPAPAATEPPERSPEVERLITVAIDAGHGGEDPGAKGQKGTYEKAVTLAIARRLKGILDNQPNMRGVLTRESDVFVPLHHRVVKARNVQADLFVSIHADAYIKPNARGSSVFALSDRGATSAAARWLAKRENDADLIGGVNLDVRDPHLKRVLLDLSQTATINDSLKLGRIVLRELATVNTLHKSRVEQAGFAVLKAPDIPSILVETAFISNPDEEERLGDEDYQTQLAGAIASGIRRYFARNPPLARSRMAKAVVPGPEERAEGTTFQLAAFQVPSAEGHEADPRAEPVRAQARLPQARGGTQVATRETRHQRPMRHQVVRLTPAGATLVPLAPRAHRRPGLR